MEIKRTHNFNEVRGDHSKTPKPAFKAAVQPPAVADTFARSEKPLPEIQLPKAAATLFEKEGSLQGQILWKTATGAAISSFPVRAEDGTVLVGSENGVLSALNPEGQIKWQLKTGNSRLSEAVIAKDGTILVTGQEGILTAVSPEGKIKWQVTTEKQDQHTRRIAPLISREGDILVASENGCLTAVSPEGKIRWQVKIGDRTNFYPVIAPDGNILMGGQQKRLLGGDWNNLAAISPEGKIKWKLGMLTYNQPAFAQDGTIFVKSAGRKLFALNPEGKILWQVDTEPEAKLSQSSYSPVVTRDGNILVSSNFYQEEGYLTIVSPQGKVLWSLYTDKIVSAPVIDKDGTILLNSETENVLGGCYDNHLSAIIPQGKVKWKLAIERSDFSPLVTESGKILLNGYDLQFSAVNRAGKIAGKVKIDELLLSPLLAPDGTCYASNRSGDLYAVKFQHDSRNLDQSGNSSEEIQPKAKQIIKEDEYLIIDGVKLPKRKKV